MGEVGDPNTEAYRIVEPVGPAGPLVFASPHSGTGRPADMGVAPLDELSLRSAEDAFVDRLIRPGADYGARLILANVSRAYVDLNRAPDDLDPELVEGCDARSPSAKARAGYGVIPRLSGDGRALYDRRLARAEAEGRIERVHAPYHAALAAMMEDARTRTDQAVLVDWHSMPGRASAGPKGGRGVDVVLGDRHGAACRGRLSRRLRALFEAEGLTVALNHPYPGGYSTALWGRPDEGYQAVQVEISRALYLDEATLTPGPGYDRTARMLERVIRGLAAEDWTGGQEKSRARGRG